MKGLFIPDITAEMFRSGCLESIEALMAKGEIYDIDYEPEQRWIPCSERLPKGFQTCIVTDELRQCSYEYDYNPDNEFTKRYGWRYNGRKIVAWMPLPEPWKEGEKDD